MHKQTLWDPLRYEFLTCSTPITGPTGSMLTWVQCRAMVPCLVFGPQLVKSLQVSGRYCSVGSQASLVKGKVLKGKKAALQPVEIDPNFLSRKRLATALAPRGNPPVRYWSSSQVLRQVVHIFHQN